MTVSLWPTPRALDIDLGAGDGELWREFSLIYNTLTLPDRSLYLSYAVANADGDALRPSLVFSRARELFGLPVESLPGELLRLSAQAPALSLAALALHGGSPAAQAAAAYFRQEEPARFARLEAAAQMTRGRLSPEAVRSLYGSRLRLSASRIDKFASCRYAYFCQYGLRAKKYEPAGFQPPEIGTFMHFVLENTARAVQGLGGFAAVDNAQLRELTDVLGIFGGEDEEEGLGDDIQALIDERQAARKEKNWARADEIRDQLAAMGITLKDTPQGVQVIRN